MLEEVCKKLLSFQPSPVKRHGGRDRVVDLRPAHEVRYVRWCHLGMKVRPIRRIAVLYAKRRHRSKVLGEQPMKLRPYRITGKFACFEQRHGDDAARINDVVRRIQLAWYLRMEPA